MKQHYEVIVAGGGAAGVSAAISAARSGADTLLIERGGFLGGTATNCSIPAFGPFTNGQTTLVRGVGLEILQKMQKNMWRTSFYDYKPDRDFEVDWVPIDTECLKAALDEMVLQSGCTLALHATVAGVTKNGSTLTGLRLITPAGEEHVSAAFFIDATGNAVLAQSAGAACQCGDEKGNVQAGTLCFQIANFDTERFLAYAAKENEDGNLHKAWERARMAGALPAGEKKVAGIALTTPGTATLNFGHVFGMDPFTADGMTCAETEARKLLPTLMAFLRRFVPGAENAFLIGSGPEIGVRESRRVETDYMLTREDYDSRADFTDAIGYYSYPIDQHPSHTQSRSEDEDLYVTTRYKTGERYAIPYRSLLVRNMDNLLVAGRIIGTDRAVQASVRMMPPCFITGQAAGTAAALCVKNSLSLRALSPQILQECLRKDGAFLP